MIIMLEMIKIDIDIINAKEAKANYTEPQECYDLETATQKIIDRIKIQIEQDSKWTNELYGKIPYTTERVDKMIEMIESIVKHYGYNISIIRKKEYATYKITFQRGYNLTL